MNLKHTTIKIEHSIFNQIKAHCVMRNIGLSQWLQKAAIAMYYNEINNENAALTGKGEYNVKQQEKIERSEHD